MVSRGIVTGATTKVDKVEIFWPSGAKEEVKVRFVDHIAAVVEGKGLVAP
jgi:hypothetical protein